MILESWPLYTESRIATNPRGYVNSHAQFRILVNVWLNMLDDPQDTTYVQAYVISETAATFYTQWLQVACPHMSTHDTSHMAMI